MLKSIVKALVACTPYRVTRNPPNRFGDLGHCLRHLAELGYEPGVVIDGGAHLGDFTREARAVFPSAAIHMVEPQPACRRHLEELAASAGNLYFHPYALGASTGTVRMWAGAEPGTGAAIASEGDPEAETVEVEAAPLDSLLRLSARGRALLKLDLQGYELAALRGAETSLKSIEVVLTEVSFFRQGYEPTILELISFLDERGFELFDIAALSSRARDGRLKQGDFIFVRRGSALLSDTAWE